MSLKKHQILRLLRGICKHGGIGGEIHAGLIITVETNGRQKGEEIHYFMTLDGLAVNKWVSSVGTTAHTDPINHTRTHAQAQSRHHSPPNDKLDPSYPVNHRQLPPARPPIRRNRPIIVHLPYLSTKKPASKASPPTAASPSPPPL